MRKGTANYTLQRKKRRTCFVSVVQSHSREYGSSYPVAVTIMGIVLQYPSFDLKLHGRG